MKDSYFLTVVTAPKAGSVTSDEIEMAAVLQSEEFANLLANFGAEWIEKPQVLVDSIAILQVQLLAAPALETNTFQAALAAMFTGDVFLARCAPAVNQKRLVIMDVDSTVIQNEVIELLAAKAGKATEVKRITDAAMAGELDFEQSLRTRVQTLAGLSSDVLQQVYSEIEYTAGVHELCRVLRNLGVELALVSGGFTEIVEWIATDLGIKHFKANQLEIIDGKLTGLVSGSVVDRATKAQTLEILASNLQINLADCVAIGDGANDLDMIAMAGLGIAFNAKPIVQRAADVSINTPDLRAALFAMGLPISLLLQS